MSVDPLTQVVLDRERDLARDDAARGGQAEAQDAGSDDRQDQWEQRRSIPSSIALTVLPISSGIRTVMPMAAEASTIDSMFSRRYGFRNASRRRKVGKADGYYTK